MAGKAPPVPAYLPTDLVGHVLAWTYKYCHRTAGQHGVPLADLWDEAITALLRATLHGDLVHGTIGTHYAQTAVRRACWRYVLRGHRHTVPLDLEAHDQPVPSPEMLLMALEDASSMIEQNPQANGHVRSDRRNA